MPITRTSKDTSTELREIVKRLDALISIMLELNTIREKELTITDKIKILYGVGLRPVEIAEILNITLTNVSVQLHRMKKKERMKKR